MSLLISLQRGAQSGTSVSVLEWDGTVKAIDCGEMWEGGVNLAPVFLWEAWVRYPGGTSPNGNAYWISEGHGGAHAILAGMDGAVPTGNVYNGSSSPGWTTSGDYTIQAGEWFHYAVVGDGTDVYVLINGIPISRTALTARQAQYGILSIGGSDHNNWFGRIASVRGFEGYLPTGLFNGGLVWCGGGMERHLADPGSGWGKRPASFAMDFTNPGSAFTDLSGGHHGQLHHGRPYYGNGVSYSNLRSGGGGAPTRVVDPTAPFGNQIDVARVRPTLTPPAVPAGARIYDSFSRADTIPTFAATPTLGSTEGGSLGVLAWSHTANRWAIFNGAAVPMYYYEYARVENGQVTADVRYGRSLTAPDSRYLGVAWRVKADRTSGYRAYRTNPTTITILRPAGSTVANVTPPNDTWTHMRVTMDSATNTIRVYVGSAIDGSWTQCGTDQVDGAPENAAETGVGLYIDYYVGAQTRATEFGSF